MVLLLLASYIMIYMTIHIYITYYMYVCFIYKKYIIIVLFSEKKKNLDALPHNN